MSKMYEIKPSSYHILVEIDEDTKEVVSESGIVLKPGLNQDKVFLESRTGIVRKIGPTAFAAFDEGEPWCEVGDRVFFHRYAGDVLEDDGFLKFDGKKYRLIEDKHVCAVLTNKE